MNWPDAALGFLLGFIVASWLAWRAQARNRLRALAHFQAAKSEILRLIDSLRDVTEVRITIRDETGELTVETDETPADTPPRSGFH
jgi:hypothetical protein